MSNLSLRARHRRVAPTRHRCGALAPTAPQAVRAGLPRGCEAVPHASLLNHGFNLCLLRHRPGQYIRSGGANGRSRNHEEAPGDFAEAQLGEGMFGKVILMTRKSDNKTFATKVMKAHVHLRQQRGVPGAAPSSLLREVKILRKLGGKKQCLRLEVA